MTATYELNANELDQLFLDSLKTLFRDRVIRINIEIYDETEGLLENPAYGERLLRAVADVEANKNLIIPDQSLFQ